MRLFVLIVSLAIVLFARVAHAEPSRADLEAQANAAGDLAAEALFTLAQWDERDFQFAQALARYEASYAKSPSNRYAQRAMNRISQLKAHSEGDFAPLARLERVRRDPVLSNDPSAIDALVRDAESFPPGLVRVEARMLVGEAYVGRMNRHAEGIAILRSVVDDPKSDPLTARQAARLLVDTMAQDGATDRAASTARDLRTKLDPAFVTSIERRVRRRTLHVAAIGDLIALATFVAVALALAKRRERLPAVGDALRKSAPLAIGFAVYIALVGGFLASSYEAGNAKPFLFFGAAVVPIFFAARAWGAAGTQTPAARFARAALCGSAMIAAAFIVLERVDPAYLEGFGL
jgi:hypothetical protein